MTYVDGTELWKLVVYIVEISDLLCSLHMAIYRFMLLHTAGIYSEWKGMHELSAMPNATRVVTAHERKGTVGALHTHESRPITTTSVHACKVIQVCENHRQSTHSARHQNIHQQPTEFGITQLSDWTVT